MLINKTGAEFQYNGMAFKIGERIIANSQSEYSGLIGHILEIRDGEDKETENETPDIYCEFDVPPLPYCCLPRKTQKVGNHGISRN